MKCRNWIEEALERRIEWQPIYVGKKGGRKIYNIIFENGSEADYYIDYDRQTIEEVQ